MILTTVALVFLPMMMSPLARAFTYGHGKDASQVVLIEVNPRDTVQHMVYLPNFEALPKK